ncbi:mycofactocin biosynthesis peptidyl-dipeptidase MftE [Klenkia taihuensis]|uniref:Creatinine amidohydrolase n=1 Tax=Klenkia taihuensis TaxID=1225127 RepID=A0A1I1HIQ2_9ACTN|nr:mycofactocin biosynthesis peptidyl-dipeptidase MftE [Klenkia taihuensis]GHE09157.1 mycofactocin system creatininase family protein [Klenkia taihuensis]SFC23696.1 creatinine amidohydrolase [Klenkia taihuensis]
MVILGSARSPEVVERPTVVVPLGSVEQHGPHLPLATDTAVAAAAAAGLVGRRPDLLLAPAVPYGASGEHEGFPGTVSIGTGALRTLLVELGRSAGLWAGRVLVVNGHGGNLDALRSSVPLLRHEGRDVAWFPCGVRGGDAHAGRTETSLMLHVEPGAVRPELAEAGETAPVAELLPRLRAGGLAAVSPNGVLGDPAGASADEGARMLADLVDRLAAAVQTWDVGADGRLAG